MWLTAPARFQNHFGLVCVAMSRLKDSAGSAPVWDSTNLESRGLQLAASKSFESMLHAADFKEKKWVSRFSDCGGKGGRIWKQTQSQSSQKMPSNILPGPTRTSALILPLKPHEQDLIPPWSRCAQLTRQGLIPGLSGGCRTWGCSAVTVAMPMSRSRRSSASRSSAAMTFLPALPLLPGQARPRAASCYKERVNTLNLHSFLLRNKTPRFRPGV